MAVRRLSARPGNILGVFALWGHAVALKVDSICTRDGYGDRRRRSATWFLTTTSCGCGPREHLRHAYEYMHAAMATRRGVSRVEAGLGGG